ncbi:hypothetical protein RO3G_09058 [Rhizopus delemar RA 99-880]|uniref:Uncharacterized protein n=1 Tax=Rhizopus delemar (strain RA 99-880 / ATCC MYA-4621 / FGSC 9543 / NRRL 43880) TaxID=246409 RepID=I1C7B8_RHIO9|nr:hypothetical protein RO3G_09058 [Rhizopus delemar RA 99-880]|eukprot:EIE84348.1 hypothetical protein RO3G_09058 [Rhizopus delemar RA 99-880]
MPVHDQVRRIFILRDQSWKNRHTIQIVAYGLMLRSAQLTSTSQQYTINIHTG